MTPAVGRAFGPDEADEAAFKPMTSEEAKALKAKLPMVSPWRVVAVQAAVGLLCIVVAWAVSQQASLAWSSMYGALAVVLPNLLMARGMTRGVKKPVGAALGFMFWEMLKIVVAVTLLVIAAKVVPQLSWPALLITMVVCMKVNWWALLWRRP